MRNGWGNGWGEPRRFEGSRMGGDRMGGERMGGESGREPMHEWDERDRGMRREPRMRDDRDERGMREPRMRDARAMREHGMRDERGMRDDPWRGSYGRDRETESFGQGEAPIVKVIEVVAQSPHSWEDATRRAVAEASRTIHDIKSVWVKDMQAIVTHDRVVEFRLVAKISFAIRPSSHRGGRDVHA